MRKELERALKAPQVWASFVVCLITLMGYSLAYWIGTILVGEWIEYRESAFQLSLGGIFFGGFMLLLPFCSALAHATSQVDDICSGMMRWEALRGSVFKYVQVKAVTCMVAAAVAAASAFVLHAILWNLIALPVDPTTYPNHTVYFSKDCIFRDWYTVCHGLPVYVEMTVGIAFTASVWAAVALAISVWVSDKLLTVTLPSFLYYLWSSDVLYYFTGVRTVSPAALFNDGLTVKKAVISIISYLVILIISLIGYYIGCKKRCQDA